MSDYLYSAEVVRVTFVTGVVVAVLFYERLQLTTGGVIVPAYLALALHTPLAVAATVAAGYATHGIVEGRLARRHILYGRRKFEIEVLIGLGFVASLILARSLLDAAAPGVPSIGAVGFLVPGIIAHDMGRQGARRTVGALGATTALMAGFLYLFVSLLALTGTPTGPAEAADQPTGYPARLIPVAILAAVLIGMLLFSRTGLRSGGFVSAAYLAYLLPQWPTLLLTAAVAVLTWAVVTRVLMPRLLLFGRRKLAAMVLCGAILGWTAELAVRTLPGGDWHPDGELAVMTLMIPALIANDAERQGWSRTVRGVLVATLGVLVAVLTLEALVGGAVAVRP